MSSLLALQSFNTVLGVCNAATATLRNIPLNGNHNIPKELPLWIKGGADSFKEPITHLEEYHVTVTKCFNNILLRMSVHWICYLFLANY